MAGWLSAAELDGTQWQAVKKNGKPIKGEVIKFNGGQMVSEGCIPYGFSASSYQTSQEGQGTKWSATQTNAKGEKMQWSGTIAGSEMTGSYIWVKPNGKAMKPKKYMAKKVS